jgi:hypothetical protein
MKRKIRSQKRLQIRETAFALPRFVILGSFCSFVTSRVKQEFLPPHEVCGDRIRSQKRLKILETAFPLFRFIIVVSFSSFRNQTI